MEITRSTLGIAVGIAGTLFLGYCVYFDQQRRKDPLFKKKLRERRQKAQQKSARSHTVDGALPDMSDYQAMQSFFIQQIQLGEELLAAGDLEAGVEHLGQAVAVCGQTQNLLGVLQQTMPAPIFHLLLKKLPEVSERLRLSMKANAKLQEEDVE
ncbi:mitochondrial import receptor subunit TOM20 homolog [Trichoplusia ni]|uniref:Mitochondrial import receptor subunit TOM20 homolog n=1 Tax=Trichoplusia ni TaxID=7111 RepID=A0A7E5WSB6_TRINI|nr:mitochondrial import receptor subunit TOM20 homolog [Trichoplusia ni]XP_026745395.1 mitochondrial import receptor subunit TOM20 homolog [Trichoplusia ni]